MNRLDEFVISKILESMLWLVDEALRSTPEDEVWKNAYVNGCVATAARSVAQFYRDRDESWIASNIWMAVGHLVTCRRTHYKPGQGVHYDVIDGCIGHVLKEILDV